MAPSTYSTTAEISYLDRLELYKTEKPYEVTFNPINVKQPGVRRTNLSMKTSVAQIQDLTTTQEVFSTDIQGFELDSFPTSLSVSELKDLDSVESRYYGEAEEFLRKKFLVKKVFIFDTTIRDVEQKQRDPNAILTNRYILGAARDCHVDQSPGSVRRRVLQKFPNEAKRLLDDRVRVINIWRPLVWPTHSNPLAMCDWRSTDPEDYTTSDHISPVWQGESLQVFHNPAHKWWFAKKMTEDEVLLLKMYDSESEKAGSDIAMCTPHSSFNWKDQPIGTKMRHSIEIRAILFS